MKGSLKILVTLTAWMVFCSVASRAQVFTPFPTLYDGYKVVSYDDKKDDVGFSTIRVMGSYDYLNGLVSVFVPITNHTYESKWTNELTDRHYQQLGNVRSSNSTHYFFSDEFHQYDYFRGSSYVTGKFAVSYDSIPNAEGIIDLFPVDDSVIYAMIENKSNYYIVKKTVNDAWETLPIVIKEKENRHFWSNLIFYFAASLLYAAAMVFLLFRNKGKRVDQYRKGEPIEQDLKLRADRPLEKKDLADGDMKQAILAITDVISNPNTPMPMTIAINGAWGSGKSSIMNCIRQELEEKKDRRFITTWFNAWHQESESSLLNAFLLKVIRRCEQPFFKNNIGDLFFPSLKFRSHLAATRFVKQPAYRKFLTGLTVALSILVIVDLCLSVYYSLPGNERNAAELHILNYRIDWKNLFTATESITRSVVTVLLPVLGFFFLQSEKSPTIGAFANIIYKKSFVLDAENKAPDMREKFRSEYWEIMGSLGDKTLVVFIDDLDRVGGKKIFEMLEALNFISDITSKPDDSQAESFKAVFVLGLYVDQVAENLGGYLVESRESINEKVKEDPSKLGLQYLEKMIQLNVPVPLGQTDNLKTTDSPTYAS